MATLTEVVAAVVVHSSAAAFSHFGVSLEAPPRIERPAPPAVAQRIVARSPARKAAERIDKTVGCPDEAKAQVVRA